MYDKMLKPIRILATKRLAVRDTFTDSNGTRIDAHTPDKAPAAWVGTSCEIQSNKLTIKTQPGPSLAVVELGKTNVRILADCNLGETDDLDKLSISLVARHVDDTHYWRTLCGYSNEVSYLKIQEINGSTIERVAMELPGLTVNTNFSVSFIVKGQSFTAIINIAGTTYSLSYASSVFQTATKHGAAFRCTGSIVNRPTLDNLRIYTL
jgi:hypothetical protein